VFLKHFSVLHFCVETPLLYICVSFINVTMNKSYAYFSKHIRNAVLWCFCRWSHWDCVAAVCSEASYMQNELSCITDHYQ
jgi:hypothetical protein